MGYHALSSPMMPNVYFLRNANEIGVMCAHANDRAAYGWWMTVFCGCRFVGAGRTRPICYRWAVADCGAYTEPNARANPREMHDEERKRRALRQSRGRMRDGRAVQMMIGSNTHEAKLEGRAEPEEVMKAPSS